MRRFLIVVGVGLLLLLPASSIALSQSGTFYNNPYHDEDSSIRLEKSIGDLVGTGVVVSSNVGRNYSVLTVWHVAKVGFLKVLMFYNCPNNDPLHSFHGDPSIPFCTRYLNVECWGPITVLSIEELRNVTNVGNLQKLSFRKVRVGELVQANGFPNGESTNLNLKVESYQTIKSGGEVLRYMILAPVDFEYFPPKLGGMSGAPVYDKDLRVVALISLEVRSNLLKSDRIAAVPMGEGLGRCRSSVKR